MTIHKNRFPILEYDTNKSAIITHVPESNKMLPEKCVVSFSDFVYKYAEEVEAKIQNEFVTCTKTYKIFVTNHLDNEVCFCEVPLGASSSVQLVDYLFLSGVKHIIASGSCGVLIDIPENQFMVPVKALRDEGVSYHYLKPARVIDLNQKAIDAIEKSLKKFSVEYKECFTWTTDGFYRETVDMVEYRRHEGCSVVEMECAAMAACAEFRNRIFGQLLFTGDSLADSQCHNQRNWGATSIEKAFRISLNAVINIVE